MTVTVDILKDEGLSLLKGLESLKVIHIQNSSEVLNNNKPVNLAAKYSGAMTKQSREEVDKQLNDLRNEWD